MKLKMLSAQRRLERYRILYCWKILENQAPNCGINKIDNSEMTRQGRRLVVPILKGKSQIKKMREQSFQCNGPKLFNSLPPKLRNISGVSIDEFKMALDKHLEKIPDQPRMDGLVPAANSNSILHQHIVQ